MSQAQIRKQIMEAEEHTPEPPRPLRKTSAPPEPYPVEALGGILAGGATAIQEKIQAPLAICAQSVLATTSLAVQGYADIILQTGQRRPLSSFFLSIAATGERKSSSDDEAMKPVEEREKELRQLYDVDMVAWQNAYDAWEEQRKRIIKDTKTHKTQESRRDALDGLGEAPPVPLMPMLTCPEPTFEGLCKLLMGGHPSIGVFSTEGGQFIGGHGMSEDNKLKTAAAVSCLWDGKPVKRVRSGDGATVMPGRRVSMHLMAQPGVASQMLSDPALADQGLLSRLLVCAPDTTAGTRFYREASAQSVQALQRYQERIAATLHEPLPLAEGKMNELAPRALRFTGEGGKVLIGFADHVESLIAPGGAMEPIRGLANKLPEHAARLAGVIALAENIHIREVTHHHATAGVMLAEYYANEALRLFGESRLHPDIALAERLLHWLHHSWDLEIVSLPDIYQRSLNAIGDKSTASRIVTVLEDHGWLVKLPGGGEINGTRRKDVWRIVRG